MEKFSITEMLTNISIILMVSIFLFPWIW